ncbi:MAG: FHA domain-containing protein [Myxococcota bacterium]
MNNGAPITRSESLALSPREAAEVACERGTFRVRAVDGHAIEVDFDPTSMDVLLEVAVPTELHDGDWIGAGRQWLRFEAGAGVPRLHVLDVNGNVLMAMTLRGRSLTLGREAGDIVLPGDERLAELHLQVMLRDERAFVQNLAGDRSTWIVLRPGAVVPSGSTLVAGERRVQVRMATAADAVTTCTEPPNRQRSSAHAAA